MSEDEELIFIDREDRGYILRMEVSLSAIPKDELRKVLTDVVRRINIEYWKVMKALDETKE